MIGRLTYEVRLAKTIKGWRWDVIYNETTDPEFPGVETGRFHLSSEWGYERFKWQATRKIVKNILHNDFKKEMVER